jgi:hypothetical protein
LEGLSPPIPIQPFQNLKIKNLLLTIPITGKEYEARGGSHENSPGSKDKPEKGPPQKKSEATKKAETKAAKKDDGKEEKPKANEGKKKDEGGEKKRGRPKKGDEKKPKEQREGERKSERTRGNSPLLGTKRKSTGTTGEESAAKKEKVKK